MCFTRSRICPRKLVPDISPNAMSTGRHEEKWRGWWRSIPLPLVRSMEVSREWRFEQRTRLDRKLCPVACSFWEIF